MSVDLKTKLNLIEAKLQLGWPPLNDEDTDLVKQVVESFPIAYKLSKQHSELRSKLATSGIDPFQAIHEEMNGDFCSPAFPKESPAKPAPELVTKMFDNMKIRQDANEASGLSIVGSIRSDSSGFLSKSECDADRWVQIKGNIRMCVLCDAKLPGDSQLITHVNSQVHREDAACVVIEGNRYSCCVCGTNQMSFTKFKEHLSGKTHAKKIEDSSPLVFSSFNANVVNDSVCVTSPDMIYELDYSKRLIYFVNKICIINSAVYNLSTSTFELRYDCLLCNEACIDIETHLSESRHKNRVSQEIKTTRGRRISFEVTIRKGRGNRRECSLCRMGLSDDPAVEAVHHQNRSHTDRVKSHFRAPRFKDWEKGIILKYEYPFCVFCNCVLPTSSAMLTHINDPSHKSHFSGDV